MTGFKRVVSVEEFFSVTSSIIFLIISRLLSNWMENYRTDNIFFWLSTKTEFHLVHIQNEIVDAIKL